MHGQKPHDTVHDVFVKQVFQDATKDIAPRRMTVRNGPTARRTPIGRGVRATQSGAHEARDVEVRA